VSEIPLGRRIALALIGIVASGYLLRPQISQALVVRGDERLYRGSATEALGYYRRAIETDPLDGSAVDRFAFSAVSLRKPMLVRDAIELSSQYLRRRPDDDVVRMDRAMAFRLLGNWKNAADDFARVGKRERDVTALTFAGYAARALHDDKRATALWREALGVNSTFRAARRALHAWGTEL
jgi:tetratricopeptide (TPR) repeat protein